MFLGRRQRSNSERQLRPDLPQGRHLSRPELIYYADMISTTRKKLTLKPGHINRFGADHQTPVGRQLCEYEIRRS